MIAANAFIVLDENVCFNLIKLFAMEQRQI